MAVTVLVPAVDAFLTGLRWWAAESAPEPSVSPECPDEDPVCNQVYDWTGLDWLAEGSFYLLVKPIRIVLIVLAAVLLRHLLHRAISRLVTSTSTVSGPAILRPLRERAATNGVGAGTGVGADAGVGAGVAARAMPERRRQRAEAIGSVLRSLVSAVVFTLAVLLVLGEMSFNLAPLLASAGIAGLALGFGAQSLVKDLIAGLFMLLEDQYGVGDTVDLGEATGVVEAVGLRITTVRDGRGVLWYIRNGEIIRVGNKSQGWAMVVVDMPIGFASAEQASAVLRNAALVVAADPELAGHFVEPPDVLGVEQITVDGAVIRTVAKTTAEGQFVVGRELRRQLANALQTSGISAQMAASRMFLARPSETTGAESGPADAT
ncbi:mechanosensitive ion channel family protein [Solwaraspora sp. WMMD406]|uniref:mechanosensitive ion channel family protein n=1 Tax=Solwaraspora sp. WMMD406 TaxID=3016095 RepID=UPI0024170A3C|nr:mechanosensitive ion channel family protein [Solwaraspora sp. WMMD406]MDG4764566.1 mechanosensitive ion channel family protein [Solwaraspora sp. WMMD406]